MKTSIFCLVVVIASFCLTSCNPVDVDDDLQIYENVITYSTGEQGQLPSEPGDDEEE